MKQRLVSLAKSMAARVFGREIVFLPRNGGDGSTSPLLPLRYDYRASSEGVVTYRMLNAGDSLVYELYSAAHADAFEPARGERYLACTIPTIRRGDELRVGLAQPGVWLNDRSIEFRSGPARPARKFVADLKLSSGPRCLSRSCFHYLPYENKPIGEDYYYGDDYVDYPQQQAHAAGVLVDLVRRHCAGGRLLEVGCALGVFTRSLLDAGFDAYGVDVSPFAVLEASKRVGTERVRRCNVDQEDIAHPGVFDIVVLWDVLEHSVDPGKLIEKISARTADGAWLFLHTSNASSLTHRLFGKDWEGYSDYSHYGVDQVCAENLRKWLAKCGWQIVQWDCGDLWVAPVDPASLRLRQAFMWFPELTTLLNERDLGDLILVIARKGGPMPSPAGERPL